MLQFRRIINQTLSRQLKIPNQLGQSDLVDDMNETAQSYAEVTETFCMAIIDQKISGQMQLLDQNKFDKLNARQTDAILSQANSNNELPEFDDARLHSGAMRVRCANVNTRKWLELNIPKLDVKKLWHGAHLVVIDFKDIPKPHRLILYLSKVH